MITAKEAREMCVEKIDVDYYIQIIESKIITTCKTHQEFKVELEFNDVDSKKRIAIFEKLKNAGFNVRWTINDVQKILITW